MEKKLTKRICSGLGNARGRGIRKHVKDKEHERGNMRDCGWGRKIVKRAEQNGRERNSTISNASQMSTDSQMKQQQKHENEFEG
jgi:hypothetical protein